MGYTDKNKQREYARRWVRSRREAWFADKRCVDCGTTENLTIDHRDKSQKISHRIWSWAEARREAELAKCDVRCFACHMERHAAECRVAHGVRAYEQRGCRCDFCRAAKAEKRQKYGK